MYRELVSHNGDIARLAEMGYAVDLDSNYLIVRDIPYLDGEGALQWGAFVTKLVFVNSTRAQQDNHQVYFAGGSPHGLDGNPIANIGDTVCSLALGPGAHDVVVERIFSNKPTATGAFADFFEKIESYTAIVAGPAVHKFGATALSFRLPNSDEAPSVFKYRDTMTSRAEITDLSSKLVEDIVAVIGLGGTGGYLFDFLVRTPVKELRGYDGDVFHVHNAFRSPGRTLEPEFGKLKAEVIRDRYESFRHGLVLKPIYMDADTASELDGVTFAFVCVDKGSARASVFQVLLDRKIPFIDVGLGLHRREGGLTGMMRMTYYSVEDGPKMVARGLAELNDHPDDMYRTGIQIGELNALNASLAVMKYKQVRGFYTDGGAPDHMVLDVGDLMTAVPGGKDED